MMISYKNILIAVDGSHEAEWAFNKAVGVANNDAQLTIVNVIDSRTYSSYSIRSIHRKIKAFELLGYKVKCRCKNVDTRIRLT